MEAAIAEAEAWVDRLEADGALVITGRFPECRFTNVVLWNAFMQSYDYANRQISLNRTCRRSTAPITL